MATRQQRRAILMHQHQSCLFTTLHAHRITVLQNYQKKSPFETFLNKNTQCLKITWNIAFEFWHFPSIFCLLKMTCLVKLFDRKLKFFQQFAKMNHFWHFWLTFVHSKCKRSSLRSQCWMRLFLWFSNTVNVDSYQALFCLLCWSDARYFCLLRKT